MKKSETLQGYLLELFKKHSASNPIHSLEIETLLSIGGSEVRDAVRSLRRGEFDGTSHPIANSPLDGGKKAYFYAKGTHELLPTLADLKSRCISMFKSISQMERGCFKENQHALSFVEELQLVNDSLMKEGENGKIL